MQKLEAKRRSLSSRVGQYNWGNRFYRDITKEADSDGPPPIKQPELWTWPTAESSIRDHIDGLGRFLCDLDDDWSGIVKMVFLMLDCYHGTYRYLSSPRHPNILPTSLILVEGRKHEGRVLLSDLDRDGLGMLQQQLSSSWFTDLLTGIRTTALLLDPTGEHPNDDGTLKSDSASDPVGQILVLVGRILSSLHWWIGETLRHETFCFEGRVVSSEAVKDIERMLSQLCRSLGQTRREEWVDEEKQRAAGYLIIVKAA